MSSSPLIGLVVPCYNEATRLLPDQFLQFVQNHDFVNFCFVNDGSSDNTHQILDTLVSHAPNRLQVIHLHQNQGKAEAVRQGIQQLAEQSFAYVGYWDADLATPLAAIDDFYYLTNKYPEVEIFCGSRVSRMGSTIKRSLARHYPARVFATYTSMLLELPIYDTQCGAKLIKTETATILFKKPFISRWFFDVEIIYRLIYHIGRETIDQQIYEVILRQWHDAGDSKITLSDFLKTPWEAWRLFWHYRLFYEEA